MLQQTAKERAISKRTSLPTGLLVTALLAAYLSLAALQVSRFTIMYKVNNTSGYRDQGRAGSKRYGIDVNDPTYPGPGVRTYGWLRNFQLYLSDSKLPKALAENKNIDHASDVLDLPRADAIIESKIVPPPPGQDHTPSKGTYYVQTTKGTTRKKLLALASSTANPAASASPHGR